MSGPTRRSPSVSPAGVDDLEATHRSIELSPRIGSYHVVSKFPSSASTDVFLAYKTTTFGFLRRAVLKWVDGRRPDRSAARKALSDEARAISCLDHPSVVSIFDYVEAEEGDHLALEYVAGTDLRRCLAELSRRGRALPWPEACFVACELLRGLAHVHEARDPSGRPLDIVHRDVNPSNVLLGDDGRIKLTDFGTVRMAGRAQSDTAPGLVKGKVRYLAPEYISDRQCSLQIDLYGVGVMLLEMITGRPAFAAGSSTEVMVRIIREGISLSDLYAVETPPELVELISRATQRDPTRRFSDARSMLVALEAFMAHTGAFTSATCFAGLLRAQQLLPV